MFRDKIYKSKYTRIKIIYIDLIDVFTHLTCFQVSYNWQERLCDTTRSHHAQWPPIHQFLLGKYQEHHRLLPRKLTYPFKINGWKMKFSFELVGVPRETAKTSSICFYSTPHRDQLCSDFQVKKLKRLMQNGYNERILKLQTVVIRSHHPLNHQSVTCLATDLLEALSSGVSSRQHQEIQNALLHALIQCHWA